MKFVKMTVIAAAMVAAQAQAAVVFDFSGMLDEGPHSGRTFSGTLSYDPAMSESGGFENSELTGAYYNDAFTLSNLKGLGSGTSNVIIVTDARRSSTQDRVTFSLERPGESSFQLSFSGFSNTFSGTGLPNLERLNALGKIAFDNDKAGTTLGTFTISAPSAAGAVPEPATWAMMIGGTGAVGGSLRMRRRKTMVAFA